MHGLKGREMMILVIVVIMAVVMALTTPFIFQRDESGRRHLDLTSVRLLLDNNAYTYIAAVGMTLVIIAGQIDLSVGSALAALAALSAYCSQFLPIPVVILITVAAGTLIGLANGLIVSKGNIHPFMVTLGTMTILRGIVVGLVQREWVYVGAQYKAWGTSRLLGIPIPTLLAIIVVGVAIYLTANTRTGREIYAVGSNAQAARLSGISVSRIQLLTLTLNGLLMGIATVAYAPRYRAIQNNIGRGFELLVISAVVVGGTSIFGGSGSIAGTILGVLFITLARSAMVYFRVPAIWEQAVYGMALLLAVSIDILRTRRRAALGGK